VKKPHNVRKTHRRRGEVSRLQNVRKRHAPKTRRKRAENAPKTGEQVEQSQVKRRDYWDNLPPNLPRKPAWLSQKRGILLETAENAHAIGRQRARRLARKKTCRGRQNASTGPKTRQRANAPTRQRANAPTRQDRERRTVSQIHYHNDYGYLIRLIIIMIMISPSCLHADVYTRYTQVIHRLFPDVYV